MLAGLEQVAELIFLELGHVGQKIDPDDARILAALRRVEQDVFAVGRPGDAAHLPVAEEADGACRTTRRWHDKDVHERPRIEHGESDILAIGRPDRARAVAFVGRNGTGEDGAIAPAGECHDVQFAIVEDIGGGFAVGRISRGRSDAVLRQHGLASARDIIFDQAMIEPAFGNDERAAAVGRPRHFALRAGGGGDALARATVLGRGGEDVAVADHGELLPVGRERETLKAGERLVPFRRGAGGPAQGDRHGGGVAGRGIEAPHAEIAFEHDFLAVRRHGRVEQAAIGEARQLLGRGTFADADPPQILDAAARRHIDDAAAIAAPHRPGMFLAAGEQAAIGPTLSDGLEPQLGLVDMAGAVAPPLPATQAACVEHEHRPVGRRGCLKFREECLARDLHRGSAIGGDAENIGLPRDILHAAREIEIFAVGRPGVELLARLGIGQPGHHAAGEIEHIEVRAATARRSEGEAGAVGRIQRAAFGGGIGDERVGDAAARRDFPDIAARGKRDQAAIGRQARLGQSRPRDLCTERRRGENGRGEEARSRQRQAWKGHSKSPFCGSDAIKRFVIRKEDATKRKSVRLTSGDAAVLGWV